MSIEQTLRGAADPDCALTMMLEHFACDGGTIHVIGDDGNLQLQAHSKGMPEPVLCAIRNIVPGKGMAGAAYARNDVVETCNLQEDDACGAAEPGARATGFGGSLALPMRKGNGEVIGAIGVATIRERTFTQAERDELLACGEAIACLFS